ncbi:MAG: hypothetical protein GHHEDOFH_00855 [Pseudorhodoplanes sp.]|nr:hypothetical protein [Pseudorhodoplanes sp.]
MLKRLQRLPKDLSLIAHAGVQFVDYGFKLDPKFSFSKTFEERPDRQFYILRPIEPSKEGDGFIDSETSQPVNSNLTYSVQLQRALEAYDGIWLPAPFLKRKGLDPQGRKSFERGPSNWARLRIVKLGSPDDQGNTHRLTFAFDSQTESLIKGGSYICPVPEDVRNETRFEFAPTLRDNSWLLDEDWVKGWLGAAFDQATKERSIRIPRREDDSPAQCAHWAFFLVLLQGIEALVDGKSSNAPIPVVRFLNTTSTTAVTPINVDLVLDIGNSRTCGVLIETGIGEELNIRDATVLELRDISRPQFAYQEPFRSHVEFVQPEFGSSFWSRMGGRDAAFNWPSFIRVGPEALRINAKSTGSQGDTGLSSPKRYLWDDRENQQPWYFNAAENVAPDQTPVYGVLMDLITQDGNVVQLFGPDARPALQPKFSRASLFTFMVLELLLQAVVQINSPGYRTAHQHPDVPRRLKRVVFTIPTATPVVERMCYEKRCIAAAKLLWEAFDWGKSGSGTAPEPQINIAYDEATCTQIVYLYNEVVEKFRQAPREFLRLVGDRKGGDDGRRLRVASLDIGGGTTDLMILTYNIEAAGNALRPKQNFREGFRRAGDDILEAVIGVHVLKPLMAALEQAGMSHPERFISGFMSDTGKDALAKHLRKLFVTRVLVPIALTLVGQYETMGMLAEKRDSIKYGEIAGDEAGSTQHIVSFFEDAARKEGAQNFSLSQVAFNVDFAGLGATAAGVMGPILSLMCEVIHRFDCDVLLISGRPSRLPIIRDLALRFLPTPPHRIIFMHEYRVGSWYPFAGRLGTIEDPKTTVAVGALLCALAEDLDITDFSLNTGGFSTTESTANFIGRIFRDGTIKKDDLIFVREDGRFQAQSQTLTVDSPLFIGFRQLPLERWPGTPLFFLDIADARTGVSYAKSMPWKVTFRHDEADDTDRKSSTESFKIDLITDRNEEQVPRGRLSLRLQTLRNVDGYWLDTGMIGVS